MVLWGNHLWNCVVLGSRLLVVYVDECVKYKRYFYSSYPYIEHIGVVEFV